MSSSQWNLLRKYLRKCTLPAAFIAGFAASLFEFPCTGGIYIAILGMLAYKTTFSQGFIYLVIYNIAFVLPLVVILVVSSHKRVLSLSPKVWERDKGKYLRLSSGLIMIAIGVFILFSGLV